MHWRLCQGDILSVPADVLICPANVFLNLSGGIGGEILLRFGDAMQRELHGILCERKLRFVQPGEVVRAGPGGTPFKAVLHAVAVDGFYRCRPADIERVARRALTMAAELGFARVNLAALGTGFGRLSMGQFAQGIEPLLSETFGTVEQVNLCVHTAENLETLRQALPLCS